MDGVGALDGLALGIGDDLASLGLGLLHDELGLLLRRDLDLVSKLLGGHQRLVDGTLPSGLGGDLLREAIGALPQLKVVLDQLLEALRHQLKEGIHLLDVVAAHAASEIAALLANVQGSEIDHGLFLEWV